MYRDMVRPELTNCVLAPHEKLGLNTGQPCTLEYTLLSYLVLLLGKLGLVAAEARLSSSSKRESGIASPSSLL